MASDVTTKDEDDRAATIDRSKGAVALADESPDELPALLALAVGVAILVIAVVWPSLQSSLEDDTVAVTETTEEPVVVDEEEPVVEEAADLEVSTFLDELGTQGIAGIGLSAAGGVVTATGEVPDEATRGQIISYLQGQPGVEQVIDELTIAEPAADVNGEATITAAQASVVLTGTVPDEATREAIVSRAVDIYSEAQVDDQLVVDAGRAVPTQVTISGALTDPVLYNQVLTGFADIEGVEVIASPIALEESSELESSLNSLEPIQFASGSAQIDAESNAILDEGAEFLTANPDVAIEIGGHTDSIGSDEANEALSQARADAVKAALEERDVTNEMTAVGFGERRLKNDPDATPEEQAENRRIEFRIIG